MEIVSCINRNGKVYCVREDYAILVFSEFKPVSRKKAKFPLKLCRFPNIAIVSKKSFDSVCSELNTPCVIGLPCHCESVGGVFVSSKCTRSINHLCMSTGEFIGLLLSLARLRRMYVWSIFVGTTKMYPAPLYYYSSEKIDELYEQGLIGEEQYKEAVKWGFKTPLTMVFREEYGEIEAFGVTLQHTGGVERMNFLFKTGNDRRALKYALRIWDYYERVVVPILSNTTG